MPSVSLPPYSPEPFWFPPRGQGGVSSGQALLLHGFTGSPYELRPLGAFMSEQGYEVTAKQLSGHTGSIEALNSASAERWLEESREWIDALLNHTSEHSVLVGSSMGALLCLAIIGQSGSTFAKRVTAQLKHLILYAPALALTPTNKWGGRLAQTPLAEYMPDHQKSAYRNGLRSVSFQGLREFEKVRTLALKALPYITIPALVILGEADQTVDNKRAISYLHEAYGGAFEILSMPNSDHLPDIGPDRQYIHKHILSWIGRTTV